MVGSVLTICAGNICRSPMAAAVLQHAIEQAHLPVRVESAGLIALAGEPADPLAVALMAERGLDIRGHRARQADPGWLSACELLLVMERGQQQIIEASWPALRGRVYRWGHWQDFDVPDPYGRDENAFREALRAIDRGLSLWAEKLGINAA